MIPPENVNNNAESLNRVMLSHQIEPIDIAHFWRNIRQPAYSAPGCSARAREASADRVEAAIPAADLPPFLQVAAGPQAAVGNRVCQDPGSAALGVLGHTFQTGRGVQDRQFGGPLEPQDGPDCSFSFNRVKRQIELPLVVGVEVW